MVGRHGSPAMTPFQRLSTVSTVRSLQCNRVCIDSGLSQCTTAEFPPSDPALLAEFKCHPTIPCGIPRSREDIDALWYHISDELLPINWSCDWVEFQRLYWFQPGQLRDTYSMGKLDIVFKGMYNIPYPIKGVMYCMIDRQEPGGLFQQQLPPHTGNHECIVFQDAIGEYYFHYDFSQGGDEYVAKFRAPCGTNGQRLCEE